MSKSRTTMTKQKVRRTASEQHVHEKMPTARFELALPRPQRGVLTTILSGPMFRNNSGTEDNFMVFSCGKIKQCNTWNLSIFYMCVCMKFIDMFFLLLFINHQVFLKTNLLKANSVNC